MLGRYDALLFDMDGTILTSLAAAERAWTAFAARHGLPADEVIAYMHGRTAIDAMRRFLPASADIEAEVRWLDELEQADLHGIAEIPGAGVVLRALPPDRWAVVTSATRPLALKRIAAAGLPVPVTLVTANDVAKGKPNPEGYCLAMRHLGVRAESTIVFEDTRAGLEAGFAAGAELIHVSQAPATVGVPARMVIADYSAMSVSAENNHVVLKHTVTGG